MDDKREFGKKQLDAAIVIGTFAVLFALLFALWLLLSALTDINVKDPTWQIAGLLKIILLLLLWHTFKPLTARRS